MKRQSFLAKNRATIFVGVVALLLGGLLLLVITHSPPPAPAPPPPPPPMIMIQPPKPPPPPPPIQPPKTITPPKMAAPVSKPVVTNTPPKPSASHVGTSIHGNGPNAFDLSGTPGGMGFGDGTGGGGSVMGNYEAQLQELIQQALEKNPITRRFAGTVSCHVTISPNGSVKSVTLDKSTGNPQVDAAITNNVLSSMSFPAPPNGATDTFPMNLTAEQPLS